MATHASSTASTSGENPAKIPIEIISDEEMALIDAAFAAVPVSQLQRCPRSINSITLLSKRGLSACTTTGPSDIEDSDRVIGSNSRSSQKNKRSRLPETLLHRFRKGRSLSVTDLTGTEWCEKQTEFILLLGKPQKSKAMKAGSARHRVLEKEVVKKVKVQVECAEDMWALRFMNFVVGTNQLLLNGLTRELPLVAFIEDVWMVGIIDEIQMPASDSTRFPILVDTKTRVQPTLPREAQKRNGRFQLMCYKYMWDTLVADKFPYQKFFSFFPLNPNHLLSPEIRDNTAKSGFPSVTLGDVVRHFGNSCSLLPQAHDQLLLRYELQEDQSLLGEDEFTYDPDLVKDQIKSCLEFWLGKREASYPHAEELWKCNSCKFVSLCPVSSDSNDSSSKAKSEGVPSTDLPRN